MRRSELVDFYLDKKLNESYDFSRIKKELKEEHQLSGHELSEVVDLIANAELSHTKSTSSKNHGFILFTIALGVVAVAYSIYGITKSFSAQPIQMSRMSEILNYLCLVGGIYVVIRNIKKLRS